MKGRMSNELGSIVIDPNVIATYAGSVAVECFGIVGMAIVSMRTDWCGFSKETAWSAASV